MFYVLLAVVVFVLLTGMCFVVLRLSRGDWERVARDLHLANPED